MRSRVVWGVWFPWWMAVLVWLVVLSVAASLVVMLLQVLAIASVLVVDALVVAGLLWIVTSPWRVRRRRLAWMQEHGIEDTPQNRVMCQHCYGQGIYASGQKCSVCKGSGRHFRTAA